MGPRYINSAQMGVMFAVSLAKINTVNALSQQRHRDGSIMILRHFSASDIGLMTFADGP